MTNKIASYERNNTIDIIRFLAMFGVISLHVKTFTISAEIYEKIFGPFFET